MGLAGTKRRAMASDLVPFIASLGIIRVVGMNLCSQGNHVHRGLIPSISEEKQVDQLGWLHPSQPLGSPTRSKL